MKNMDGQYHLHLRKRIHQKEERYPSPDALKRFLDRIMVFIALAGPLATVPQIYQVYLTQDTKGLSPITWIIWTLLSLLWVVYGFVHKEMPILVANSIYVVLQMTIVVAIFLYS